jgi:hypothetical protein
MVTETDAAYVYERDALLAYVEMEQYIQERNKCHIDIRANGFFEIPAIHAMPPRYTKDPITGGSPIAPFTPGNFFDYCVDFDVSPAGDLIHKDSELLVCQTQTYWEFRCTYDLACTLGYIDNNSDVHEAISMVEHVSSMHFIDAHVFIMSLLDSYTLPPPVEFGLLGMDTWYSVEVLASTYDPAEVEPVNDAPVKLTVGTLHPTYPSSSSSASTNSPSPLAYPTS